MPLVYGRSDTYIEELDLSGEPQSVSTSTGVITFASKRGRLGPFRVNSVNQFILEYGKPDAKISFGHYCALAFLARSNQLYCNRVVEASATYGGLVLQKKSTDAKPKFVADSEPDPVNDGVNFSTMGGATNLLENLAYFYATGPGSYSSSLTVEIESDNLTPPTNVVAADFATVGVIIAGVSADGSLGAGTYTYTVTAVNSVGETLQSTTSTVTLTGSNNSVYISWDQVPKATAYKVYGRSGTASTHQLIGTAGGATFYFIDRGIVTPAGAPPTTQTYTDEFTVRVRDYSSAAPDETYTCTLFDKTSDRGEQMELTQQINLQSKLIRAISNSANFTTNSLPVVFSIPETNLSAGSSGGAVSSVEINLGWAQFEDTDAYKINILINGGYSTPSIQIKMDQLAQSRFDCVPILDVPSLMQDAQAAIDYRNNILNLNSNRSALYCSDVLIEDPYTGSALYVPPSGHIAAVYAYTDSVSYPWRAPAGLNRGLLPILGVRKKYSKGEMTNLKNAQVNYIRDIQGLGRAVWEQRTLQAKLSALSFVNVRRLMDFCEQTAANFVRFEEFEPNDDFTRISIRSSISQILDAVVRARGINKFQVICDDSNNPKVLTAQGVLKVTILIEPTLAAETIVIQGVLTQQGADFNELIASGGVA